MIVKGYLFSVIYALVCLALAFFAYKLGVEKKITRKLVHIFVGFEWVILYHFMGTGWHFLAVCILFLVILSVSYLKNLLPMISSDGDNSPGTVYYAVAMTIMAILTLINPDFILPFGIGVFCTSIGDGLAGLVGQSVTASWNKKIYGNKTILGALVNLVACFLVGIVFAEYFNLNLSVWNCIAIALFALELELFVGLGLDNIAITLGISLLSFGFIFVPSIENYIIPILLTPMIIAFSYKKKALTVSGIVAAVVLDVLVSFSLGNFGFLVLFLFFVGGIISDKVKKSKKKAGQSIINRIEKRGDCRDYVQVVSNGLTSGIFAVCFLFTSEKIFLIAYIASLAEALADTVASGIGSLSNKVFDIFRMKRCTPGISGGMSLIGTLSALVSSFAISFFAIAFGKINLVEFVIIGISAFFGSVFDSFLGSVLQIKYKCKKCGIILEKEYHCEEKTERHSGLALITNDSVNLLSTIFSALLSMLLFNFI